MKKDTATLIICSLILMELTLGIVLAYQYYQKVQPTIAGLENTGTGLQGLFNLLTGKTTTAK